MKKLQIVKTCSEDGEVHFILMEIADDNSFEKRRSVDEAEVREIMKNKQPDLFFSCAKNDSEPQQISVAFLP